MKVLRWLWANVRAFFFLKIRRPSLHRLFAGFFLLGGALLCYLAGAATMHFQLPMAHYWRSLFFGAQALQRPAHAGPALLPEVEAPPGGGVTVDRPGLTDDGFTLYATSGGPWAALIDMRGNTVQRWGMPFRQAWPHLPHVEFPALEKQIHWFGCRLFPNGDLLAVYHGEAGTLYGYGLVKLDKDSRLLWAYDSAVHHDFDVGEDGTIYVLSQQMAKTAPAGMEYLEAPLVADSLVLLSPEGKQLDSIPLLEAFRDSKYASTLETIASHAVVPDDPRIPRKPILLFDLPNSLPSRREQPGDPKPMPGIHAPKSKVGKGVVDVVPRETFMRKGDYLHPNGVSVLRPSLAAKLPMFRAGQVLVSLRNIDTLAVIDVDKRSVVWAAQGLWRRQHAAQFLENGHLLVYDNLGGVVQSRVLEFDPASLAIPWSYSNENSHPYLAIFRGATQRLPNGNTLIVNPETCRLFEVTPGKEVVWECFRMPPHEDDAKMTPPPNITSARRYRAEELTFLRGVAPARP